MAYAVPEMPQWIDGWRFELNQRVRKRKGSQWQGRVVGFYMTHLTTRGYAIESETHFGSVQIYPEAALEPVAAAALKEGGIVAVSATVHPTATICVGASVGDRATVGVGASVGEGASVGVGASVGDSASVGNRATVGDCASIGYRATVGDGATVGNRASVGDGATVGNRVSVGDGVKYDAGDWLYVAGPQGSRGSSATAIWSRADDTLRWWVGCQWGLTTEQFRARVEREHGGSAHGDDYRALISFVETHPALARARAALKEPSHD